jgi:type IV pilus assembly protein PilX
MKSHTIPRKELKTTIRQRGVVLFFTLMALVVMSLAAVALIRSVDTSTMIAGNLAFKQTAITSGDVGVESAMTWMTAQQQILTSSGKNIYLDSNPPVLLFNLDNPTLGYYSSVRPVSDLTDGTFSWTNGNSVLVGTDASGNTIRFMIERMCTTPNVVPTAANCLFATPATTLNNQAVVAADQVCQGAGCVSNAQSPQLRITAQVIGPRNTYSYIQTFAY